MGWQRSAEYRQTMAAVHYRMIERKQQKQKSSNMKTLATAGLCHRTSAGSLTVSRNKRCALPSGGLRIGGEGVGVAPYHSCCCIWQTDGNEWTMARYAARNGQEARQPPKFIINKCHAFLPVNVSLAPVPPIPSQVGWWESRRESKIFLSNSELHTRANRALTISCGALVACFPRSGRCWLARKNTFSYG